MINTVSKSTILPMTLSRWAELITTSIAELFPPEDPDDEFAEITAIIDIGNTDNP